MTDGIERAQARGDRLSDDVVQNEAVGGPFDEGELQEVGEQLVVDRAFEHRIEERLRHPTHDRGRVDRLSQV